ncbi:MAG: hypothetical protein H7138_27925 [Myxococcales bacterium]|nr:hypothetical protein [Myxococcales bacterium]
MFRDRMRGTPVALDEAAADAALDLMTRVMRRHVEEIVDRDGMPHLAHLINGWGNARLRGRYLLEHFGSFVHRDDDGRPFILQCDVEGDFHPWQGFAYAVMAGIDLEQQIPGVGASLAEVARNSVYVQTQIGRELGHLLYGLAHLETSASNVRTFFLEGEPFTVHELVEHAVVAHIEGDFKTCKKIHLTEGLCAAVAKIAGLEDYREEAQSFLAGQLEQLHVIGVVLEEARRIHAAPPGADVSLLDDVRASLQLGRWFENLIWQAGHLTELAQLAAELGYEIAPEHEHSIAVVLNEVNGLLPAFLPHTDFVENFLVFGHFRRGVSLLLERQRARREGRTVDLARFAVDFDAIEPANLSGAPPAPNAVFDLYHKPRAARPRFIDVVERYATLASDGLEPRGAADHFRRIGPPGWPRALHYELLDYGDEIGAELHLESRAVHPLGPVLRDLAPQVAARFPGRRVDWDPTWWRKSGRLRVLFDAAAPADEIAVGLSTLIAETYPAIDGFGREAQVAGGASVPVDLSVEP